jgi:hypothetical protein
VARYKIAPEQSHVWIDARSNIHPIHASTDGLEGHIELQLSPGGAVDTVTQVKGKLSLRVDRISSGNRLEDREMQRRINARRFPSIDGVLCTVERSEETDRYRISGDVTFRGVSCRHEDWMSITSIDDETLHLEGTSRFDIRDFGMEPPRMLLLRVEPEVDVRVAIVAIREEH